MKKIVEHCRLTLVLHLAPALHDAGLVVARRLVDIRGRRTEQRRIAVEALGRRVHGAGAVQS